MAQVDSENITARPVDQTRLAFFSIASGLVAGGVALASAVNVRAIAAATMPDPIFAAIDAHKTAAAVYFAAVKEHFTARQFEPDKLGYYGDHGTRHELDGV